MIDALRKGVASRTEGRFCFGWIMVALAGHGMVPRNLALLCERTWSCHEPPLGPDRHPNTLGFRAMAETFASELGLEPVGVELD